MATNEGKTRNTNLDILRILSMLLIILLHSVDHSGVLEEAEALGGAALLWVRFAYMLSQVCVNCFVLLSGYFLCRSEFRLSKLAALWLETVFYSLAIKLGFMLAGAIPFSVTSLASCFVPVFTGRYWFVTIYFGLYLLSPFLNIAIRAMTRRTHAALNITLFALFSATVSVYPSFAGINSGGGWGLAWFVVLYFAAAWVRLYYVPTGKPGRLALLWVAISAVVTLLYVTAGRKLPVAGRLISNWFRYDSVPVYICSVALLACFAGMPAKERKNGRRINVLSKATFGVYLIHAHSNFAFWTWEKLRLKEYTGRLWFPLLQLALVLAVFALCAAIDILRQRTVGKLEQAEPITNACAKMQRKVEAWISSCNTNQEKQ